MMRKIIIGPLFVSACTSVKKEEKSKTVMCYEGNTPTHAELCRHADTYPDTAALWYLDRNYNFLILSGHNQCIYADSINLPTSRRQDFILIAGEEVYDYQHIHTTAMNINRHISLRDLPLNLFQTKTR